MEKHHLLMNIKKIIYTGIAIMILSVNLVALAQKQAPIKEPLALFMHALHGDFNNNKNVRVGSVIAYKNWDGSNWMAKLSADGKFVHALNGVFDGPDIRVSDVIAYKSWDDSNWMAKYSKGILVHAPNGDFKNLNKIRSGSNLIAYKTWDNSNWMANIYLRSLSKDSNVITKGTNVYLEIDSKVQGLENIPEHGVAKLIYYMDSAYMHYKNLVGSVPKGGPVQIKATTTKFGYGEAYIGTNLMLLSVGAMQTAANLAMGINDWTFVTLHELGHLFDTSAKSWEVEFTANLKIYYIILNDSGANVFFGATKLTKESIQSEAYAQYVAKYNNWDMDSFFVHKFLTIANTIGWGPFTEAFKAMNSSPSWSRAELFKLFINKLKESSKMNVWSLFNKDEIAWLEKRFGGKII